MQRVKKKKNPFPINLAVTVEIHFHTKYIGHYINIWPNYRSFQSKMETLLIPLFFVLNPIHWFDVTSEQKPMGFHFLSG